MATVSVKKPATKPRPARRVTRQRSVEASVTTVSARDFNLIKRTIKNPPAPNEALLELAKLYRHTVTESR